METTKPAVKNKPSVKKVIWLTILGFIALGFISGWLWPDGTAHLSPAERAAAHSVFDLLRDGSRGIDAIGIAGTLKFTLEKVEPFPSDGSRSQRAGACQTEFDGTGMPPSADRFKVWYDMRTVFGIKIYESDSLESITVCRVNYDELQKK